MMDYEDYEDYGDCRSSVGAPGGPIEYGQREPVEGKFLVQGDEVVVVHRRESNNNNLPMALGAIGVVGMGFGVVAGSALCFVGGMCLTFTAVILYKGEIPGGAGRCCKYLGTLENLGSCFEACIRVLSAGQSHPRPEYGEYDGYRRGPGFGSSGYGQGFDSARSSSSSSSTRRSNQEHPENRRAPEGTQKLQRSLDNARKRGTEERGRTPRQDHFTSQDSRNAPESRPCTGSSSSSAFPGRGFGSSHSYHWSVDPSEGQDSSDDEGAPEVRTLFNSRFVYSDDEETPASSTSAFNRGKPPADHEVGATSLFGYGNKVMLSRADSPPARRSESPPPAFRPTRLSSEPTTHPTSEMNRTAPESEAVQQQPASSSRKPGSSNNRMAAPD